MTSAITQLDTSIERLLSDDGKSIVAGENANVALSLLYAKLERMLPASVKKAALKRYDDEADQTAKQAAAIAKAALVKQATPAKEKTKTKKRA